MFFTQLLLAAGSLLTLSDAASCYQPSGTQMNSTVTYQCPTNGGLTGSMCCRAIDPSGASGPDTCLKVGNKDGSWLCQNSDGTLWRRGCSDRTWASNGCVNVCSNTTKDHNGIEYAEVDEQLTPCSDGSYCCGPLSVGTPCCQAGGGFFIVDGKQSTTKPSSSASSGTSAATITVTITGTAGTAASSSGSSSSSGGISSGAVAGSAVGGFAAGALIMALIACLMGRRSKRKNTHTVAEMQGEYNPPQMDAKTGSNMHTYSAGHLPSEVEGAPRRHELD